MSSTIQLPDKPSELIRLALSDLRKCEGDPNYEIRMEEWHRPGTDGETCWVCLAGSVMAKSLNAERDCFLYPTDFGTEGWKKLQALNSFRNGNLVYGLQYLGIHEKPGIAFTTRITSYSDNREQFHLDMESLAALLQNHGL